MNDSQMSGSATIGIKEQIFSNKDHFPIAGTIQTGAGQFDGIYKYLQIPDSGNYVVAIMNGQITFIPAPSGGLSLFNNSLGWTATQDCE